MKHFIFTYSEDRRKAHCEYTVCLYQIKHNQPVLVGRETETFVGKDQLVLSIAEKHKVLPRKCFERHAVSQSPKHTLWSLKQDGIATFTEG